MKQKLRFGADVGAEAAILDAIAARIHPSEFDLLREEGGFAPPNDFPVDRVGQALRARQFPRADWYEYEWAIYECGFEALERCSVSMRAYLAFTYIYCNKRKQWGISIESDFFYALIQSSLSDRWLADLSLRFIEWLNDCVTADEGYEDYYALLSWLLLRRIRGETADPVVAQVVEALLAKAYTSEQLSALTVSDRNAVSWLELYRRLPGSFDTETDRKIVTRLAAP